MQNAKRKAQNNSAYYTEQLQRKAERLLDRLHTPPQRYGTAFHVSPPITDVRELRSKKQMIIHLEGWDNLKDKDQQRLLKIDEGDAYGMWHLSMITPARPASAERELMSRLTTRLIHIPENQNRTIRLKATGNQSELYWIVLEANARCTIDDQLLASTFAVRRMVVIQHQASELSFTGLRAQNDFLNESVQVYLAGKDAKTTVTHLFYMHHKEQADSTVAIHHEAPATTSLVRARAAVNDKAVSIYRGLIEIARHAAGSRGYQHGRSLLLSEGAVSDMLPQLEINTDDVQCSHGVTTTHLDDSSLFYLQSRGLSPSDSRSLATRGFYHTQLAIPGEIARVLEDVIADAT